ncbi:MAG: cytochrome c3 family protein [Acidobacteriota bacterium]
MSSRLVTVVLLVGLSYNLLAVAPRIANWRLPGDHTDYEPAQPVAFSHRVHAGELQVACLYCHFGAERSRHAGIPPLNVCMNCHRFVTAPIGAVRAEDVLAVKENRRPLRIVSPEIAKIYRALGLGDNLAPDPARTPEPVAWITVHNLPDFVYFDHRPHVAAAVTCQTCHGPVETMERVRQVQALTMGWCVNCHRDATRRGVADRSANASIDCVSCHF